MKETIEARARSSPAPWASRRAAVGPDAELLACYAASYSHPVAWWLLGGSLHPGGLALTGRLAEALAQTRGCQVTGLTLEEAGVEAGRELARHHGVAEQATFRQGDAGAMAPAQGPFDAVILECVLSILPDKARALGRLHKLLRPSGRLGLTDVTVSGPLPQELQGLLAVVGCVGGARPLEEYRELVEAQGFVVDAARELPEVAGSFLREAKGKQLMAEIAVGLGKLSVSPQLIGQGRRLLAQVQELVSQGLLGYGMLTAHKPSG